MLRRAVAAATKAAPMCAEINPTSLHNNLIQRRWAKITADNLKVCFTLTISLHFVLSINQPSGSR